MLPTTKYAPDKIVAFYAELDSRLKAIAGVQGVTAMTGLPPLRDVNANDTDFEHIPNNQPITAGYPIENVDYWQYVTADTPRPWESRWSAGEPSNSNTQGPPVVLINEALARSSSRTVTRSVVRSGRAVPRTRRTSRSSAW